MTRLLVVQGESLTRWLNKGELVPRYFNPGDLFDEVHFLLLSPEDIGLRHDQRLQEAVGRATARLHSHPQPSRLFIKSLGWRPSLLRLLLRRQIEAGTSIRADVIRAHGLHVHACVASQIASTASVPMIISLHGNPDVDYLRGRLARTTLDRIKGASLITLERQTMHMAYAVIAVYSPVIPYLERMGIDHYSLIPNVVGINAGTKTGYQVRGSKARLLCVGRQQLGEKDPTILIDAIRDIPEADLLLVGDGDLHDQLVHRAQKSSARDRIRFARSLSNEQILHLMQEADLYVYCSWNYEISKSCMEAALVGLPCVINVRPGPMAAELLGGHFCLCRSTSEDFARSISELLRDPEARRELGSAAHDYAMNHWNPVSTERRLRRIYEKALQSPG